MRLDEYTSAEMDQVITDLWKGSHEIIGNYD